MKTFTSYKLAAIILVLLIGIFIADTVQGQTCNAVWYNNSWLYRKAITIDYTKVSAGPHTNFPILVNITDTDLQARALSSGNDILFTASDGTTKLNHEIESYTSGTGALIAWVQIPSLSSSANTIIYMYYGNSGAANQQNVTGTWDANFAGVYHLNTVFTDATSNARNGANTGTTDVAGKIARGRGYTANSTNKITITGLMGNPANVTLSAWENFTSLSSNADEVVSLGDHLLMRIDNWSTAADVVSYYWDGTTYYSSVGPCSTSGWHYVSMTFDDAGNLQKNYVDGVQVSSTSATTSLFYGAGSGSNTIIGNHGNAGANYSFAGSLDEVRVTSTVRSAGWLLTEFNNQSSPATFYSAGSQQGLKIFTGTGNFSTAARWTNSVVPVACEYLIIDGACTIDNSVTTDNVAYGPLVIGYTAARTLNWAASGTNRLNVTNVSSAFAGSTLDMTNGGTLRINGTWTSTNCTFTSGTGTIEVLSTLTLPAAYTTYNKLTITGTVTLGVATTITDNFVNNGTFTHGGFRVTFTGSSSTITGSSTTNFSGGITINKTASTDVLDVQSLITLSPTSTTNQMTLTQGVFKLSSASTITPFWVTTNATPWDIATASTFWCNHASAVVNSNGAGGANGGSWSFAGTLRVTAGTVNVGTGLDDWLAPRSGSLIIDGGNLVVTGRLSQAANVWTFNMSSGTVTVGTFGSTGASRAVFNMDASTSSFTMTGGTIIVQKPGDLNKGFFNIATNGGGFTGGTLQIGNASTPAATTIKVETNQPIYNLVVNSANVTAQVATYSLAVSNDVTLTAGTLDPNALNTSVGRNWTNNATYTTGTGGIIFNGTANQTIGGSNSTTFYDLTLNNTGTSGNDVVTLSKAITVSDVLTLTDGILATTATNLLTLTNPATTATTRGNSSGPSFVSGPIRWNGLNGAGPFVFPTGAGTSTWARVAVSGITSATDFTAQYFNASHGHVTAADISSSSTYSMTNVSRVEYWDVARSSGTGSAAVTLYWERASTSHITGCASNGPLKVAHYNTSSTNKWENANSSGVVTTTGSCIGNASGSVTSDVISSFSPFTFGSSNSGVNPLPIELLNFNAVFNGTTTDIGWETASEINNNYFTVERSADGVNFTTLSNVTSKALNGNSTSTLSYALNDPNTVPGVYYYRLKQTDFDFKHTYSNVVVVTVTKNVDFAFDLAPNPNDGNSMTGFITTPSDGMVTFKIYNTAGSRLYMEDIQVKEGENNPFKLQFKDRLESGTYIVIAMLNGDLTQKKLMMVVR